MSWLLMQSADRKRGFDDTVEVVYDVIVVSAEQVQEMYRD
jgi:hypothetical protein